MKKLFLITTISMMCVMPVYGQADTTMTIIPLETQELVNKFEEAANSQPETKYQYTSERVNIRRFPSTEAEILDTSLINTCFEVIAEFDGWAMITTEDGYAYMKADWFTDEPIERNYTDEDLEVLTRVLTGECHTYPDEEQLYVGSVVLNRVKNPEFPDSIKEVVFQKGQYSCVTDGNYYREPTERNRANAKWLLENGSVLPEDVVYQSGGKQGEVYLKTKFHYYCK